MPLSYPRLKIETNPMAPLWETSEIPPGQRSGTDSTPVAAAAIRSGIFTKPSAFGPRMRIPDARQSATISACRSLPSAPTSAKPEEKTIASLMPFSAHSRRAGSTAP